MLDANLPVWLLEGGSPTLLPVTLHPCSIHKPKELTNLLVPRGRLWFVTGTLQGEGPVAFLVLHREKILAMTQQG